MYLENKLLTTSTSSILCIPEINTVNIIKNLIIQARSTATDVIIYLDSTPILTTHIEPHDAFEYSGVLTCRYPQKIFVTPVQNVNIDIYASIVVSEDKAPNECTAFNSGDYSSHDTSV